MIDVTALSAFVLRTKRRFEGTGLGLPLTQAMMALHGGSLVLASRFGEGTTATLRLPATRLLAPGATSQAAAHEVVT